MQEKKLKYIFHILRVIETAYLLSFFFILYLRQLPHESIQTLTQGWIIASLMVLPLLILKNILVGVYRNGLLSSNQKFWLVVRSVLFILLTIYSYPLILNL